MGKTNQKDYKNIRSIEDCFYFPGCILLLIQVLLWILFSVNPGWKALFRFPPCPFHLLTGCYCPGCGGTRAVTELLNGHILRSFCYHPIVLYGLAVYVCFMITQTIERISRHTIPVGMRYRNIYVWAAAGIVMINFVIKNILRCYFGFIM